MRENVHYARCVCDFCGEEEHIADSLVRPRGWDTINVGHQEFELCESCFCKVKTEIQRIISDMKQQ